MKTGGEPKRSRRARGTRVPSRERRLTERAAARTLTAGTRWRPAASDGRGRRKLPSSPGAIWRDGTTGGPWTVGRRSGAHSAARFRPLALLLPPLALGAQVGVVIHGRVEDAVSESPVAGALVRSADSASVTVSDSLGTFAIELDSGVPFLLVAEQFGYLPTEFALAEAAPSQVSVLRLPPVAIELEGVTVVGESELEEMVHSLTARRDAFAAPSRVMDREALERFGAGDAFDLVVRQVVNIRDCVTDSHPDAATVFLCRYARGSSERLLVCLDGVELVAAACGAAGHPRRVDRHGRVLRLPFRGRHLQRRARLRRGRSFRCPSASQRPSADLYARVGREQSREPGNESPFTRIRRLLTSGIPMPARARPNVRVDRSHSRAPRSAAAREPWPPANGRLPLPRRSPAPGHHPGLLSRGPGGTENPEAGCPTSGGHLSVWSR